MGSFLTAVGSRRRLPAGREHVAGDEKWGRSGGAGNRQRLPLPATLP
jgi:hypothetical protein